ncbi:MAG: MoaD/ThiS family protein [Methanomassiliicoccales archaeon]
MNSNIKVILQISGKEIIEEIAESSTVEDLLRKLSLHPDAYIIVKDKRPVPLTKILEDGERLRLVKVASGG